MRKMMIGFLLILLLSGIFAIAIQSRSFKKTTPEISRVIECLSSTIAYADSVYAPKPPQPPVPPDDPN